MKLKRTLKISEQEFYNFIEKDFVENFKACTGKDISVDEIKKGVSYVREDKKVPGGTKITITEYQRNHCYGIEVKNVADTFSLLYHTCPVEKGLEVTLNQTVASFNKKRHNKLMRLFSEAIYLGRMSDTLYDIQKRIHKERSIKK